jgi:hypothetical protein
VGGPLWPSPRGCYCHHRILGFLFSGELSAIIGNDRVRDPKTKNDVLDEIHGLLRADFCEGLHLGPLSKFIDHDE